jgi:hypothetical protein
MCGALIALLGATAVTLASSETFARTGGAPRGGFAATHSISRPSVGQPFRHHRRTTAGAFFWPGTEGFYGPNGEPLTGVAPPTSSDIHYTYTYDVPWDWAHRYPPAVTPSDRPYVPSCPAETVRVPGRDGSEQTVNITRCY